MTLQVKNKMKAKKNAMIAKVNFSQKEFLFKVEKFF